MNINLWLLLCCSVSTATKTRMNNKNIGQPVGQCIANGNECNRYQSKIKVIIKKTCEITSFG